MAFQFTREVFLKHFGTFVSLLEEIENSVQDSKKYTLEIIILIPISNLSESIVRTRTLKRRTAGEIFLRLILRTIILKGRAAGKNF